MIDCGCKELRRKVRAECPCVEGQGDTQARPVSEPGAPLQSQGLQYTLGLSWPTPSWCR